MLSRIRLLLLAALFVFVALPAAANASAPSNDNFADAQPLSLGTDVSGTNLDATAEAQEPTPANGSITEWDCSNATDGPNCTTSVWYTFQPATSGTYTIETCDGGTDLDTVLGVWTGSLGALTEVASNDDGPNHQCAGDATDYGSQVTFAATGGTVYHVEVAGYSAAQGSFYIRAYPHGSPPAAAPDTEIGHNHSYAAGALQIEGATTSGGRHTASFDFTSTDEGATFQCSLDGAAFGACSSPVSYDLTGSHTFAVRAVSGGQTDPTPAVQRFTVDGDAPDTVFTNAPTSPSSAVDLPWSASGSERDPANFMCSFDGTPTVGNCDFDNTFGPVCNASHEFRIAEVDRALNADPTPAVSDVTETGGSACAAPTLGTITTHSPAGTEEDLEVPLNVYGYGGTVHVDYGTTSSYGTSVDQAVWPGNSSAGVDLYLLQPGTLYHYRVRVTTPAGTVDSGDRTFATGPANGPVPSVSLGTPVAVGNHAAAIPLTLNAHGDSISQYGVLIDPAGDPTLSSPFVYDDVSLPASNSPQARTIDAVDLEPGTYHVRAFAWNGGTSEGSASPEVTFTIPAQSAPPTAATPLPPESPSAPAFVLKRSSVRVGKITRHSKFVTLTLKGLPPLSTVTAQLNASVRASSTRSLGRRRVHANSHGVAKIKIKLSKKARKLLRNKHTKSLSLRITVAPKLQKPTHITLHPKLRR